MELFMNIESVSRYVLLIIFILMNVMPGKILCNEKLDGYSAGGFYTRLVLPKYKMEGINEIIAASDYPILKNYPNPGLEFGFNSGIGFFNMSSEDGSTFFTLGFSLLYSLGDLNAEKVTNENIKFKSTFYYNSFKLNLGYQAHIFESFGIYTFAEFGFGRSYLHMIKNSNKVNSLESLFEGGYNNITLKQNNNTLDFGILVSYKFKESETVKDTVYGSEGCSCCNKYKELNKTFLSIGLGLSYTFLIMDNNYIEGTDFNSLKMEFPKGLKLILTISSESFRGFKKIESDVGDKPDN